MDSLALFNKALKIYSLPQLSEKLNLHTGTLKRWKHHKKVPDNYESDFLRILNIKKEIVGERKKDQFFTKPEIAEKCFLKFEKVMKKN